jgi:very-short-patch-repair endonuclease
VIERRMAKAGGWIRGVNREVRAAARELRKHPTPAEEVLWRYLRRRQQEGLRFRRQYPVGRFVLDFCCPAIRLVVEIDGEVHAGREERDSARTAELEAQGYSLIRFRNEEVMGDVSSVLERIRIAAAGRRSGASGG